jgi:YtkA-like
MTMLTRRAVAMAAPIGLWAALASPVLADVKDYEFKLVQGEVKKGDGAIVSVRLLNKRSGKPVPDAVIAAKRIDMAPDGMEMMAAPLEQLPSTEPGVYRFKANLMMEGRLSPVRT